MISEGEALVHVDHVQRILFVLAFQELKDLEVAKALGWGAVGD